MPSLYVVDCICRALIPIVEPALIPIVGSEMMPIVDLKYNVNTYTKQRMIRVKEIKHLQIRKINHRKS